MSSALGPFGQLNPYASGVVEIAPASATAITTNILNGRINNLPVGTYAISCVEAYLGTWASSALVTVTGAPWSIDPTQQITYYTLSAMAGQVAAIGGQTANTLAIVASTLNGASVVYIGNTDSVQHTANYSIIKLG